MALLKVRLAEPHGQDTNLRRMEPEHLTSSPTVRARSLAAEGMAPRSGSTYWGAPFYPRRRRGMNGLGAERRLEGERPLTAVARLLSVTRRRSLRGAHSQPRLTLRAVSTAEPTAPFAVEAGGRPLAHSKRPVRATRSLGCGKRAALRGSDSGQTQRARNRLQSHLIRWPRPSAASRGRLVPLPRPPADAARSHFGPWPKRPIADGELTASVRLGPGRAA